MLKCVWTSLVSWAKLLKCVGVLGTLLKRVGVLVSWARLLKCAGVLARLWGGICMSVRLVLWQQFRHHVPHMRRLVFVPRLPRAGSQRVRLGLRRVAFEPDLGGVQGGLRRRRR